MATQIPSLSSSLLQSTTFQRKNGGKIEKAYCHLLFMDFNKNLIIFVLKTLNLEELEKWEFPQIIDYLIKKFEEKKLIDIENDFLIKTNHIDYRISTYSEVDFRNEHMVESFEIYDDSCPICLRKNNRFIDLPRCNHRFCEHCLYIYLKMTIENKGLSLYKISCPQDKCLNILDNVFIGYLLDNHPKLFEKYNNYIKRNEALHNFSKIECINPHCDEFLTKPTYESKINCLCGESFCFNCRYPWHENQECIDFAEESHFSRQFSKNNRICPLCKELIEKNEHRIKKRCQYCHFDFCWICTVEWDKKKDVCPNKCSKFSETQITKMSDINLNRLENENCQCDQNFLIIFFDFFFQGISIFIIPYVIFFRTILIYCLYLIWASALYSIFYIGRKMIQAFLPNSWYAFFFILPFWLASLIMCPFIIIINIMQMILSFTIQMAIWLMCVKRKKDVFYFFKLNHKSMMPIYFNIHDYKKNVKRLKKGWWIAGFFFTIIFLGWPIILVELDFSG